MSHPARSLLAEAQAHASAFGFNLLRVADVDAFDACRARGERLRELWPQARSAVVLGVGGRAPGWRDVAPEEVCAALGARVARALGAVRTALGVPAAATREILPDANHGCSLTALAECAGMAIISPVSGHLMHPTYGPWVRVCGALLADAALPADEEPAPLPLPCSTCADQPCVAACPVDALQGGAFAARPCAEHRHRGGCRERCAVRAACPVGAEHRWPEAFEATALARSLAHERRLYGLGWWGVVPSALRARGAARR